MQTQGGLVQQEQGAARIRPGQFPGQFDPLGFATGKRRRGTIQGQVSQSHGTQKPQPGLDLPQQAFGDALSPFIQIQVGEVRQAGKNRLGTYFRETFPSS